jgi:hypothetical protein
VYGKPLPHAEFRGKHRACHYPPSGISDEAIAPVRLARSPYIDQHRGDREGTGKLEAEAYGVVFDVSFNEEFSAERIGTDNKRLGDKRDNPAMFAVRVWRVFRFHHIYRLPKPAPFFQKKPARF